MPETIQIEAKVVGQKKALFTDWHVPIPSGSGSAGMTLRDLITSLVISEVEAFRQRQEQRRLAQVLSPRQIEAGATQGKISAGEQDIQQEVSGDAAVGTALQAFEDGLYFVFINDVQQTSLDQQVFVSHDSRVLFVRLVALAGG